jgi:tRNA pseudouridine55 synthase
MSKIKVKPLIVVDKPHGISSMTVVRILRNILKPLNIKKIGYAGTLDPYATGVLVVGIGRDGTKCLGTLSDKDKKYVCEIDLMKDSFSGDMDNFKDEYQKNMNDIPANVKIPSLDDIIKVIDRKFIGDVKQIPPALSAIKISGTRAYKLVRKGIDFQMKERTIKIYKINVLKYDFPILKLCVECSKGTYIRTLGKDIGKELGLWGTLVSLRRTMSGEHTLNDALILDQIKIDDIIDEESSINENTNEQKHK